MEASRPPMRAGDFYRQQVLPALAEQLDRIFPEFGWRRDPRGWTATNDEFTHARLGVRADRVVAHGPAPSGLLVHGGEPIPWTAYLNNGSLPRGPDFLRTVKQLAERAGVDPAPLDRAQSVDRRAELQEAFFQLCRRELAGKRGAAARAYLQQRGFPPDTIPNTGLGVVPAAIPTGRQLERSGYQLTEIAAAGILADARWPGRLCGAWRDQHNRIGTLWARSLNDADTDSRYLYLKGATRTNLPPYGLADLLARMRDGRRELVLVEGVLDLHQLRAHGIENIAALGGTATCPQTFERLHRLGIETVTLCLDNDQAGRAATTRAVEHAARARHSPDLYLIDPDQLGSANDPDAFIRTRGRGRWNQLIGTRSCGIAWRTRKLIGTVRPDSPLPERRAALARAGTWLATLPPRLALEQEDALHAIAEQCGYSSEATIRSFRARYWNPPQHERQQPTRSPADNRGLGLER